MKIGYFSPSYRRPEKSKTQLNYPFVKLVVMESEKEEYRKNGNKRLVVCPDEVQGNKCRVLNWILDQFQKKYDCIVLMDDDISGVYEFVNNNRLKLNPDELKDLCQMGTRLAKDSNVMYWGLNPAADKASFREHMPFSFCAYLGGSFQAFLKGNELRYDENLSLKDDYDMTLQQIHKYKYNLRLNWLSLDALRSEQEGGCATYRNMKREQKEFMMLRKKWGSDVVRYDSQSKQVFDYNPILKLPY